MELMCCLMVAREAGWKSEMSRSSVMMSVLVGGDGWIRGGRFERSRVRLRGDFEPALEERREERPLEGGEEAVEVGKDMMSVERCEDCS